MELVTGDESIRYNDFPLRIIAALLATHYLVVYGIDIPLFKMMAGIDYWLSLFASLPLAIIQIELVAYVVRRLDKKYPWTGNLLKRALLQFFWGICVPGIIEFLLGLAYFTLRGKDVFKTFFYTNDYPLAVLMIIVVNFYYVAFYFAKVALTYRKELRAANREIQHLTDAVASLHIHGSGDETHHEPATFLVTKNLASVPIRQEAIAYFIHEEGANFLVTHEGDKIFIPETLDQIGAALDSGLFFQVNRKFIVNYYAVSKSRTIDNGKIELHIAPAVQSPVIVSQKRAKDYRQWVTRLELMIKSTGKTA
ncbi:LytTR family transcriptional regulator DNA-binding domain-containing protein [Pedobacter sp. KR3-3]|uniref:LytTR family transcriptional regulator DNA-binding domain-containing protein n=1 Tax=Pedobacter albus TaxID=3113905 RepID=A0ABU7IAD1_9SPHI|nr:LytTR family transcriptional regulator DNA-binding domain-containing protein [Pedobacter sp. KR3-3]MEE1946437.1 LytTR family transcriptional regulator DNA-binding domain-containing protein [Pedobacter sp. KR3-3]